MKRISSRASLLLSLLLVSGCASVDVIKTGKGYVAPTNPNTIEILKTVPTRPYTELGSLTASNYNWDETGKMYNGFRARAADLGADAVIVTASGIIPRGMYGNYQWAQAVAIKWTK